MARLDESRLGELKGAAPTKPTVPTKPSVPYDPLSGKVPDYVPPKMQTTDEATAIIQAAREAAAGSKFAAGWTPIATIVTQNGQEVQVDSSGRASDGSIPFGTTKPKATTPTGSPVGKVNKKVVSTFTDPTTGDVIAVYEDGSQSTLSKGTNALTAQQKAAADLAAKRAAGQSAYDLLYDQFSKNGLGALVEPLKDLITSGLSKSEFTIKLRETPAYQKRFAANAERIKKGLAPLDEDKYIALEDQYQNVMRNYGLPETYWTRGDLGVQEGFTKLLASDVSPVELENRIMTAQDRVLKANPQVAATLKAFYPDITNGDILAYTLDPKNALKDIQRKVTAAEIGGAAAAAGLSLGKTPAEIAASEARAQMLAGYGVTKQQATTGFQTVADVAPRGSQLAEFYNRPTYGQMEAEQEVFNLEGAAAARKKRQQLVGLEKASFLAKSGAAQGALGRERAGNL